MKDQSPNSKPSTFLQSNGGKTKSNAIEVPSISLPKGGGAIKGIDEKFSVNAVNGTSSFTIPLPISPSRGISPSIGLTYSSGAGNSAFGLGWSLSLGSIKRKTEKALPQYLDSIDSDVFIFSGADDLVPEFKKNPDGSFQLDSNGDYKLNEIHRSTSEGNFTIRFYKPRIEGLFARIERWIEDVTGCIKWRVITKDNITSLFGWTASAIISDPDDATKIFEWLPEFIFDDKGNCSHYLYKKEDSMGFDESLLHNRNRNKEGNISYTNLYLEKVLYGNKTPYLQFGDSFPNETNYMFQTVFDYGTNDFNNIPFDQINHWDFRHDAFSDYKAGFEIRTTRLCKRVLLFHVFEELAHKPDKSDKKTLIRSVNFDYDVSIEQDFTFLKQATSFGYIKKPDGSYSHKKLPAMEFDYQKHDWNDDVKTISTENLVHAPVGLDDQHYQFTDLFNEGLSGILSEQANGWYYKHNLGNGQFDRAKLVSLKPSFAGLGGQLHLADLDADGGKQLVSFETAPSGYFELDDHNQWHGLRPFNALPNIDFSDANTRMLDLNGDGKPEVVISEDNVFTWYASEGRAGFAAARKTIKPFDEETGPQNVFADAKQTIYLADMSGDGMTDIVRIRNGEVCYWPNLGYGKFGAKVGLDNAPVFDHPDTFNPSHLRLADIDGSGTTDIIYLGKNKFTCWKNLSGNRFSPIPFEIDPFPEIHSQAKITVTDLLGNGVACIVWSSTLPKDANAPLKYIDLMSSKKPHVMVSYKNNLGKEVSLEYAPSTRFYLEDKREGKPWVTKLHFPIHCVSKTITEDKISGYKFVSEYKYHHGYYDHAEREFRGFGMVEQIDAETFAHWVKSGATNITEEPLHQEPLLYRSWHHTGAFLQNDKILNQFEKDYWYNEMDRKGFSVKHIEQPLPDAHLIVAPGMDPTMLDHLSAQEWQEAYRACKGMSLRSEIFAKDAKKFGNTNDAIEKELTPFSVATHNCVIELLQPKGKNKHAVFIVKESEAITYNYERNPADPRIAHSLNIKLDEYGNVLEQASVVYPRKSPDPSLPAETRKAQNQTVILYTQAEYTNDVITVDSLRLRQPSAVRTYELKESATSLFSIEELENKFGSATKVPYEAVASTHQKRLIEHVQSIYLADDLKTPLPLGQLETLGFPYESYQLAYTPSLLTEIFGTKIIDQQALMTLGRFVHHGGDNNWWVRSGTAQYLKDGETFEDASARFFLPISFTEPFGAKTSISYDRYGLSIKETEDAIHNKVSVAIFNYRTMSPQKMRDINGNFSEAITDELGMIKAMAVYGKGNEADDLVGLEAFRTVPDDTSITTFLDAETTSQLRQHGNDLLKHASMRLVYDLHRYVNSGGKQPAVVASIVREQHYVKNAASPVQLSFEYSNGLGQTVMKKVQDEPGFAKKVVLGADDSYSITEVNTGADLRWIGNGRTILNNKGNPVKQYEPFFSVSHQFEDQKELVETGVTPILYYDAAGRMVRTVMPDKSVTRVEFDAWQQASFDQNDTVLEPGNQWYAKRIGGGMGSEEKAAAQKAAAHAGTPARQHLDVLGRPVLSLEDNGDGQPYPTRVVVDVEGNLRALIDARGNTVMSYKYDLLGNMVYQNSMDAGQRWLLTDAVGKPLRTWDERGHEFQYAYDILHRPTHSLVLGGETGTPRLNHVFDYKVYGESLLLQDRSNEAGVQAKNALGQVIQHFDTGGLIDTPTFDFKGKPDVTTRRLFKKYKEVADWKGSNLFNDLETQQFKFITEIDALSRITQQIAPDGSIILPSYNEAGLLNGEKVQHLPNGPWIDYLRNIEYNEKGQRNFIQYGNGVKTSFSYDPETFRLSHLKSTDGNKELQNLQYTYDAVGNITRIQDDAHDPVFFNNRLVEPVSTYTYDALYRLIEATGRENVVAPAVTTHDNWNDAPYMQPKPMTVRKYKQEYQYDQVGNIQKMIHNADGNDWTRFYNYQSANNRLISTQIGNQPFGYTHHAEHGFITKMPHLEEMGWNFKEELVKTRQQRRNNGGTPETTYYQYDGSGQRIRKITEHQAAPGAIPNLKEERIYIAGYELYKKHSNPYAGLERVSLSLMDGDHRFVMIETRNGVQDGTLPQVVRYQLHNHLGSAALELDGSASVISYEEYHPYGTTAFQNQNKDVKAAAKRYRFTGMERDEESGLSYHSARYYLPWLGRWLSADPIGIEDGVNLYGYCGGRVLAMIDCSGNSGNAAVKILEVGAVQVHRLIAIAGNANAQVVANDNAIALAAEASKPTAAADTGIIAAATHPTVLLIGALFLVGSTGLLLDQKYHPEDYKYSHPIENKTPAPAAASSPQNTPPPAKPSAPPPLKPPTPDVEVKGSYVNGVFIPALPKEKSSPNQASASGSGGSPPPPTDQTAKNTQKKRASAASTFLTAKDAGLLDGKKGKIGMSSYSTAGKVRQAEGTSGETHQGAHLVPMAVYRKLGLSPYSALVINLTKESHDFIDGGWVPLWNAALREGREITGADVRKWVGDAIQNSPDPEMTPELKGTLGWRFEVELAEIGITDTTVIVPRKQ